MFHVISDMDGVILDTERMVIDGWVLAAPEFGLTDIDFLKETCRRCIGTNYQKTKEIFMEAYGADFDYEACRQAADRKIHEMQEKTGIPVKRGAAELFSYLKEQGIAVGLASSTKRAAVEQELRAAGLFDYFDSFVGGDMVTHSKPHPEIYLAACGLLGVSPSDTYAIEDSYHGVSAAHAAGMKVLLVPDELPATEEIRGMCTGVFDDLLEVRDYFKGMIEEEKGMKEKEEAPQADKETVSVIPEDDYESVMREVVEPELVQCLTDGYCAVAPGISLHYQMFGRPDFRGTVVVSHGFTESALKFHEMAYYFLKAGFQVFLVDHRGHASSTHEIDDASTVYIREFEHYVTDLHEVILQKVLPQKGNKPLYLYAHSMGGAIASLYLGKHPDIFDKCVLNAPMIAPLTGKYAPWVANAMASAGILLGQGKKMPYMYKPYDEETDTFENSPDTSRPRFEYYKALRIKDSRLQTCSPSYRWVKNSLGVTKKILSDENCRAIQIPVLLFQADEDAFVVGSRQQEFVDKLPNARLVHMDNTKHEIYYSSDEVLQDYLNQILNFLR